MIKRGLLFFIALFVTLTQSFAYEVTFQVDMSNQTVSPNGVHLAGSFSDPNGDGIIDNALPNWNPGGIALTDAGNGIWAVAIDLVPGFYEYKFVNGNDWSNPEFFASDLVCAQLFSGNRSITIGNTIQILPVVCWNECVACGQGCTDSTAVNQTVNRKTIRGILFSKS